MNTRTEYILYRHEINLVEEVFTELGFYREDDSRVKSMRFIGRNGEEDTVALLTCHWQNRGEIFLEIYDRYNGVQDRAIFKRCDMTRDILKWYIESVYGVVDYIRYARGGVDRNRNIEVLRHQRKKDRHEGKR